jgi:hypothetical protein
MQAVQEIRHIPVHQKENMNKNKRFFSEWRTAPTDGCLRQPGFFSQENGWAILQCHYRYGTEQCFRSLVILCGPGSSEGLNANPTRIQIQIHPWKDRGIFNLKCVLNPYPFRANPVPAKNLKTDSYPDPVIIWTQIRSGSRLLQSKTMVPLTVKK